MKASTAIVLGLGIGLLALGCVRGEQLDVFRKAMMVCLECIGIG